MQIYLVRHGETEWNREEVFRGQRDIPLSETGRLQAEKTGRYFAGKKIAAILSSPLKRALQTAAEIARTTGVSVEESAGLTDMYFGPWEGLSLKEVRLRYPEDLEVWQRSPQKLRLNQGERLGSVRRRAAAVLGRPHKSMDSEGAIVVVTHRVICKLLVLHLLSIPSAHFWDMKFDPSSVTLIEKRASGATLLSMNDTCHLSDTTPVRYRDF